MIVGRPRRSLSRSILLSDMAGIEVSMTSAGGTGGDTLLVSLETAAGMVGGYREVMHPSHASRAAKHVFLSISALCF